MTAEARVNGKWVNPRQKANHFFDAECIALALAAVLGFWAWDIGAGEDNAPGYDDDSKKGT
jgi:hypothetical protein